MTASPFLLGSTLLFWGWQSQLLLFAVPMAVILESAHWLNWRWRLSDKDFNRVTDLTSLLLLITTFYLFNEQSFHGLMTLLSWLPILFFLLMMAQVYSTEGSVKLSSLFLSLRHHEAKVGIPPSPRVNLYYPYIMMCLLATSVSYAQWFFAGVCIIIIWILWLARPQRYSIVVWLLLLMITGTFSYLAQLGIVHLQTRMEEIILSWFQEMLWIGRDPYRQNTALGDLGRLKQSDRIVLRVKTPYPLLLREASYNLYFKTSWRAHNSLASFHEVKTGNSETTWSFIESSDLGTSNLSPTSKIRISTYLHRGTGMLPLPHGTYQLSELAVPSVQYNHYGAVKVERGPGLIEYTAHFGHHTPLDEEPDQQYDLYLPPSEEKHLREISNQLNLLHQDNPRKILNILTNFFNQHFQYSLDLTGPRSKDITPLEYFLHFNRKGHCEYFATATVLLLRTAGIPSRYASGYAVEEFSELEDIFIVRQRHAHAWTLAFIDGHWQEFDTTPAIWVNLEEENATWWEPLYDLGSWITYKFSQWRWHERENSNNWLIWLILPLILILIWRLYSREKVNSSAQRVDKIDTRSATIGTDSAFYQVVQQLNLAGYTRSPGENLSTWLKRIQVLQMSEPEMQTMLTLHQRYRFDPAGMSPQEQTLLKTHVQAWLQRFKVGVTK